MSETQYARVYVLPFLLWPLFLVLSIGLLPIAVLVFVLRSTEYLIYRALYDARLLPPDDIVWTMGTRENQLLINCCLVVDGELKISDFRKLIDENLIKFRDDYGKLLRERLTLKGGDSESGKNSVRSYGNGDVSNG